MVKCPWCARKTHPPEINNIWLRCKCGAWYAILPPPVNLEEEKAEFAGSYGQPAKAAEILMADDFHPEADLGDTYCLVWVRLKVGQLMAG